MQKLINNKFFQGFVLLFMLTGLVFTSSCEEEEPGSDEVTLLSFGPSGVKHGDDIIFIGENLDRVTSIVFKPSVEVSSDAFSEQSSGVIKLAVPEAAEAGLITLKTPKGEIESLSILNFEVPVVISSITAEAKPGTNITITGEKINWIESVTFASDLLVEKADFVSQNLTEMVVQVPTEAQSGFLIFATGGTEPLTFGSEEQLTVTLPAVSSISPSSIRHTGELTIAGTDLDLVTSVIFNPDTVTEFVSQTETTIVVAVPATTETGALTLTQASPVNVVTADALTIILPIVTAVTPSPAVPGEDVMVITGADLDLVAEIILPGAGSITDFLTNTETEISFNIPASATQGALSYVTIHGFAGPLEGALLKLPPTGGFPTLDYYIYNDGLQNGWEAYGGWGHTSQEYDNGENPANGDLAIKSVFNDSYGAVQINNTSGPGVFDGYNYLVFYVYVAGEESDIIAQIGDNSDYYPSHFTGDEYHQIVVPLADLAGSDNVNELRIKNNNPDSPTNPTTVYIDEIGLSVDVPEKPYVPLDYYLFNDELQNGWEAYGGWGHTSQEYDNVENPFQGETAIKTVFNDAYGAVQINNTSGADVFAGYTSLVFYVYVQGEDSDIIVQVGDNSDYYPPAFTGDEWHEIVVPLSELAGSDNVNEIRIKNNNGDAPTNPTTVFIDEIGLRF